MEIKQKCQKPRIILTLERNNNDNNQRKKSTKTIYCRGKYQLQMYSNKKIKTEYKTTMYNVYKSITMN